MGIWELDETGTPVFWTPVSPPLAGWIARSLKGNEVLIQRGTGGPCGIWGLGPDGTPATWIPVSGPLPGWIMRSLD